MLKHIFIYTQHYPLYTYLPKYKMKNRTNLGYTIIADFGCIT